MDFRQDSLFASSLQSLLLEITLSKKLGATVDPVPSPLHDKEAEFATGGAKVVSETQTERKVEEVRGEAPPKEGGTAASVEEFLAQNGFQEYSPVSFVLFVAPITLERGSCSRVTR